MSNETKAAPKKPMRPTPRRRPGPGRRPDAPSGATTEASAANSDAGSGGGEDEAPKNGKVKKSFKSLPAPDKNMTRKQLADQYMPYVRSIAGKIKKTLSKDIEFDDLVSYGMLGLFEAADRFDAKYGANFMTFAYYRIRGAIYDGLRGMGWVSRTEYQRYRFEQHANSFLNNVHEQQLGVPSGVKKSDDDEVGELANVVEGLVTIYVTALDAMEGFQVKDDRGPSIEESMEMMEARQLVAEAVGKLPDQEKTLLELYYYKEMSLEEVGKQLGLSKSWTSRLHTRAISKLSRLLKELVTEYSETGGVTPKHDPARQRSSQPTGPPGR